MSTPKLRLEGTLGVHTGTVVVGEMGSGDRHENLATGETVNIAARLEGLAQANTVVISRVTERLVRGSFALENLGSQQLKGVAEPMDMFRVLQPLDTVYDEDESMPDGGAFLVGRDEEVGLLLRRWEQSKEGLGQVVYISGEAGIGKSSLTATMRQHVMQEGYTRITFRCSPYHVNSALYPVITHLEQILGFGRDDTPGDKLDKLEQALRTTSLPLEQSGPLMATLLSVPLEDRYPAPTTSPQQQRQQTLDTLVAWLIEEGENQPVLAVWEDMHWGDPSTLELLRLVLEQTPTVSMFNVLTFRPEFSPPWSSRSHMTPIILNRLERPQVEALITHLAGKKALLFEVVEHIVTKTDGVPLYVEELTKMLLSSEMLRDEADRYELMGPLNSVAIPDTLQDSLMARLDQMDTAKEVAQLGAVLGREFAYEFIQAISSQDEERLQADLSRLVEAELLYQRGRPPQARFIFKHALVQDAAYTSLLKSTRQRIHQQIAQLFETRFPEAVEVQPELVAHHYTEANCTEEAVSYWQRAGNEALERSANLEGISHLQVGLSLMALLPETPMRNQFELDMQVALGPALVRTKGYGDPDVERVYKRAHEICLLDGEPSKRFSVLWGLWRFYSGRGIWQTTQELSEQLLQLAREEQDPTLLMVGHGVMAQTMYYMGIFRSVCEHAEQGLALSDPAQRQVLAIRYGISPEMQCYNMLARSLWYLGYPEQALKRSKEMLALAEALGHSVSHAVAGLWHGHIHQLRRELDAARQQTETSLTLMKKLNVSQGLSIGICCHGWLLAMQGQGEEGLIELQQGLAAVEKTGTRLLLPRHLLELVDAHRSVGQIHEGLRVLKNAATAIRDLNVQWWEIELHHLKGKLLQHDSIATQNVGTAPQQAFMHAIDIARDRQVKSLELRVSTSLALLWQQEGKRAEARDLLTPAYEWFTEGFDTADLIDAKALLGELKGG